MNHTRIVHAVFNSPWAIDRSWFGSIFSLLHSRVFGGEQSPVEAPPAHARDGGDIDPLLLVSGLNAGQGRGRGGRFGTFRMGKVGGKVINHTARIHAEGVRRCGGDSGTYYQIVREEEAALPAGQILHVFGSGILGKHLSSMDEMCSGGLSVDRVQDALRNGRDDDKVSAIMLHLDTPGGICYGMAETAALMRECCAEKTVASFCDSLTASAGIWCTCCADYSYVTPSADLGSVGVYSAFVDYVEYCKKAGIAVKLITDGGTYKGAGYPGTALSPEQEAKILADVMACSKAFKDDVRMGRKGISDDAMQGQCFTGQAAVDAKFADACVNDLEDALEDLAKTV